MEPIGFLLCIFSVVAFFSLVSRVANMAMRIAGPVLGGAVVFYIITTGFLSYL